MQLLISVKRVHKRERSPLLMFYQLVHIKIFYLFNGAVSVNHAIFLDDHNFLMASIHTFCR